MRGSKNIDKYEKKRYMYAQIREKISGKMLFSNKMHTLIQDEALKRQRGFNPI